MPGILSRIYMNLSSDYFTNMLDCNIDELVTDVAEYKSTDGSGVKLFEEIMHDNSLKKFYFMGCTKILISNEADHFVNDLEEAYATESMGKYVSKKQVNNLMKAFNKKEGRISGYSFVIFHIIYKNVRNIPDYDFTNLKNCVETLNNVVKDYIKEHSDPVAQFLLQCYNVVYNEISTEAEPAGINDFPPVPKRHHCNYNE